MIMNSLQRNADGRPAPALHLVIELEDLPSARIVAYSFEDELRLLDDVDSRGRRLAGEVLDALEEVVALMRRRRAA
jgi:hypothetical protein